MSTQARLRWRCRRGTRELDALLGSWLNERYAQADAQMRADFDRLLDVQDPDLWDWLMGHSQPADAGFVALVEDIRGHEAGARRRV